MKKLFVCALAVGMFTACSQDETIEMQSPMQISFEGAYVENATRAAEDPSFSNTIGHPIELKGFDVWAFMDERNGKVFEGEDVTKTTTGNTTKWTYVNTQYWLPNHTYYFGALAPMNSTNWSVDTNTSDKLGVGQVTFTNINGKEDLIYAATAVTTGSNLSDMPAQPIKLHFGHLLSKVKFSFKNGFTNANNYLKVENITMQVPSKGSINLDTDSWWKDETVATWTLAQGENPTTLSFGHMAFGAKIAVNESTECDYECLTIPASANQSYLVTFKVTLYNGELEALTRNLSTTITGAQLRMGYAYNFIAVLDPTNIAEAELKPIEFEVVEIKDWIEPNEYNGDDIDTEKI